MALKFRTRERSQKKNNKDFRKKRFFAHRKKALFLVRKRDFFLNTPIDRKRGGERT